MAYSVILTSLAEKQLDGLASTVRPRIAEVLRGLAETPRPHGCKKLKGQASWGFRVGDYRIIYLIDDGAHAVRVTWIGPRGAAYRGN